MAKEHLLAELKGLGVDVGPDGVRADLAEKGIKPITGEEINRVLEDLIKEVKALAPATPPSSEGQDLPPPPAPVGTTQQDAPPAPTVQQDPPKEEPKKAGEALTKAPKSGSVDIVRGKSTYVRSYSEEVHGEGYFELAQQLVAKEGYAKRQYRIVDSADIPEVVVLYREKEDAEKKLDEQSPDSSFVDKEKKFTDKQEALSFSLSKRDSSIVAISLK